MISLYSIYHRLCRAVGYSILIHDTWNPQTFELEKRNSHIALYKYLGAYRHDGSMKMRQIWILKIR